MKIYVGVSKTLEAYGCYGEVLVVTVENADERELVGRVLYRVSEFCFTDLGIPELTGAFRRLMANIHNEREEGSI